MPIEVHWMGAFVRAPAMKFSVRMVGEDQGRHRTAHEHQQRPFHQRVVTPRDHGAIFVLSRSRVLPRKEIAKGLVVLWNTASRL